MQINGFRFCPEWDVENLHKMRQNHLGKLFRRRNFMKLHAVVKVYEDKGQTKVEVPFCSDDVSAVQKEQERLLAVRALERLLPLLR